MAPRSRYQNHWIAIALFGLMNLMFVVVPVISVNAQSGENSAIDDATHLLESTPEPSPEKPDGNIISPDEIEEKKQFDYSLFLPSVGSDINAQAAATDATWQTIHLQTFEGTYWPASGDLWTLRDVNGPSVGVKLNEFATLVWDDNSTRGYNSYWAAHPNDGAWAPQPGASPTYANHTDTWMRYGPFSLVGATDARFSFVYWLNSESSYDYFSWEVACKSNANYGLGESRSGMVQTWVAITQSLTRCLGQSTVYLKFRFISDYSNPSTPAPTGVWVDNIRIEKYQ